MFLTPQMLLHQEESTRKQVQKAIEVNQMIQTSLLVLAN